MWGFVADTLIPLILSPLGTLTSCVGFSSTTSPSRAVDFIAEKNVEFATKIGGGSQQTELDEGRDVLELILKLGISLYYENR